MSLKIDDDLDYIPALRVLDAPNVYCHICNNLLITLIVIGSFALFGLHEGSVYHKFNKLFFSGVSFLMIDLCPIAAPGGTGILGQKMPQQECWEEAATIRL